MEASVRKLFERYERVFQRRPCTATSIWTTSQRSTPPTSLRPHRLGVMTGKNDEQLKQVMAQGYGPTTAPSEPRRCAYGSSASRRWTNTIASRMSPGEQPMSDNDKPDVTIDFDVHYLVQQLRRRAQGLRLGIGGSSRTALKSTAHLKAPEVGLRRLRSRAARDGRTLRHSSRRSGLDRPANGRQAFGQGSGRACRSLSSSRQRGSCSRTCSARCRRSRSPP